MVSFGEWKRERGAEVAAQRAAAAEVDARMVRGPLVADDLINY